MTHSKHVNDCIESICEQGCTAVRDVIVALEEKQDVEQVSQLPENEIKTVLTELKKIMSVYDIQE